MMLAHPERSTPGPGEVVQLREVELCPRCEVPLIEVTYKGKEIVMDVNTLATEVQPYAITFMWCEICGDREIVSYRV